MNIVEKIVEKTNLSKFLFEQFNQQLNVDSITEYCLKGLPRRGTFTSNNGDIVEFFIHGSDIDFSHKGKKVICDRINFEYFKAYTLGVFINDRTDFDLLVHIDKHLVDLEKDNKIKKVKNRVLTYYPILDTEMM